MRGAVFLACAMGLNVAALASEKDLSTAFPNKEFKIQVVEGEDIYRAEWTYTNPYELPLVVEKVDSDCGCLEVEVDSKKQVKKGESGKIVAGFAPGARQGLQRILLKVHFVGYHKPVELIFMAKIPAPVEVSVQELKWTAQNREQTQTVDVTTGTSEDFKMMELNGLPKGIFTIKTETVKKMRHYRLYITPTGKAKPGIQYLQICTDSREPIFQVLEVYLRVE